MFDSFVIQKTCQELTTTLVGKRIQKISIIAKDRFVFKFGGTKHLLIDLSAESYHVSLLTQKPIDQVLVTGMLTSLRKHLTSAKLISVEQHAFDRTIELRFSNLNSVMEPIEVSLYLEMMGRHANAILVDQGQLIIQALKFSDNEAHPIVMGMPYELFPSSKKNPFESGEPIENAMDHKGFNKALLRLLPQEFRTRTIREISHWIMESSHPSLYQKDNRYVDYHLFRNDELYLVETVDIFQAMNSYYAQTIDHSKTSVLANHRQRIQHRIRQLEDKLILLEETRTEFQNADEVRMKADIIYASLYQLKPGQAVFEGNDFEGNPITIEMDTNRSASQNAQHWYETYQKMTRGLHSVAEQTQIAQAELATLQQLQYDLQNLTDSQSLQEFESLLQEAGLVKNVRKKSRPEASLPIEIRYRDVLYTIGRNSLQNERLISHIPHRDFVWFHAKGIPGSHVVMHRRLEDADDDMLLYGAKLAATYSKAGPGIKIPVDYITLGRLRKPKGSPPGFVTFTGQQTVQVSGDERIE